MTPAGTTLRQATPADRPAILDTHRAAFGTHGDEIAVLVDALLDDPTALPLRSLVAECDGTIVGHVLFTSAWLPSHGTVIAAQILAPLAVRPVHQGRGIGGALIETGLRQLAASDVGLVFVLGDPRYYGRFGFTPAKPKGIDAPHTLPPEYAEAWMVKELYEGATGDTQGRIQCADALSDPRHWLP